MAALPTKKLGKNGPEVTALGFGLMGMSLGYGAAPPDEQRFAILDRAFELGCTNWDTADVYGDSEDMLARYFAARPGRREQVFLATKFAISVSLNADGSVNLGTDSSPRYAREACEKSLQRLGLDSVDLYYVHRTDKVTPIEQTMEALVELKKEGKIKYVGLSECNASTLRRACAVEHVDAVQVEYNPWSLEIEGPESHNLLAACRELGVAVFCYSPLGRGIMTGRYRSADDFEAGDFRRSLPRYSPENFHKNLELVESLAEMAKTKGCTPGQLCLAWILTQGTDMIPIPGTRNVKYLEENVAALEVELTAEEEAEIRRQVETVGVLGDRNPGSYFEAYADTPALQ